MIHSNISSSLILRLGTLASLLPALLSHSGCDVCKDDCQGQAESDSASSDNAGPTDSSATGTSTGLDSLGTSTTSLESSSEVEVTGSGPDNTDGELSSEEVETESGSGGNLCGDGIVDPGETCDDGDHSQLDGCSNECQPSATIVWRERSQIPGLRTANAVTLGPTGQVRLHGEHDDSLYVGAFSQDGQPEWNYRFRPGEKSNWAIGNPHNVFVGPRGSTFVLGTERTRDNGPNYYRSQLYVVAPDGTFSADGVEVSATEESPIGAGFTADGHFIVLHLARRENTDEGRTRTLTIWHYDSEGQQLQESNHVLPWQDHGEGGLRDEASWAQSTGTDFILGFGHWEIESVARIELDSGLAWSHHFFDRGSSPFPPWPTWTPATNLVSYWTRDIYPHDDGHELYSLNRIHLDGTRSDLNSLEPPNIADYASSQLAHLPDGSFVVGGGGLHAHDDEKAHPWLWHFDPNGRLQWNSPVTVEPGEVVALAPLSNKALVVGLDVETPDSTASPWVMRIALP